MRASHYRTISCKKQRGYSVIVVRNMTTGAINVIRFSAKKVCVNHIRLFQGMREQFPANRSVSEIIRFLDERDFLR